MNHEYRCMIVDLSFGALHAWRSGMAICSTGRVKRHPSPNAHQLSARHPEVRQRKQRDDLRRVLRHTAVAHLGEPELPLEHTERMLNLARMLAFIFSTRSATNSGWMNGLSRLRNPGRIATCHVGPPPRIACARLGSRRRRRPRVLQLHRLPSTAPDLGLLHGVHLTPWWTPSSTSRPLNSRRVRRTLTPKTQTSQSTKVTSTCREVRSFVISLDDRTTLLTRSCKVQCDISSPRIVGCAVHASHSDVLEDGIHDVRTVAGTAHPPVNRLFHAALSCCEILPPPTQVVAGCDHPLTRVATVRSVMANLIRLHVDRVSRRRCDQISVPNNRRGGRKITIGAACCPLRPTGIDQLQCLRTEI